MTSQQPVSLAQRVIAEQVRAHYRQIPAMVIAPCAGGLFTAWVLWDAVQNIYLVAGMAAVLVLSAIRLVLYRRYFATPAEQAEQRSWKLLAVAASGVSGVIWGSAAPFLYPPVSPGHEVYLLVLLTLLPIVPVAALAVYMPAFYAYYFPCMAPFVAVLALADGRAERMSALLLLMMMMAMLTFARRYNGGLTEAIRLKLELAEKTDALQQAMLHKSRFIAAASHDLRQPVHAMGLFLESLHGGSDPVRAADGVAYIEASLRNLRGMLNDMLEVSKLDANAVSVQRRDFDAGGLLGRLRDEYAPLAARQRLQFRCRVQPAVIHSDPALLERMLRNLLSNALKFTRSGGIALVCRAQGSTVRLQVIDTGCGIPAQQLDRVFDEFTQIDNAERDDAKGLGLGLAIVQRMAQLLSHALGVRSAHGRGSVFTLSVARGQRTAPPALLAEPSASQMSHASATPPQRVVVIDDDDVVGAATAALVRQWGHPVLLARSGPLALAALKAGNAAADLLIVDYRLGHGETGLDAIALLERALGRKLPAIIVTGDSAPQRILETYEAGHALLLKPVDPQRLLACIAAARHNAAEDG